MHLEPFVLPVLIAGGASASLSLLATVSGSFVYDARETSRIRRQKRNPHARANRLRPLVTVLVSTRNDSVSIERCLDSIFQNNYRNIEVLVVDNASSDWTAKPVRNYISRNPRRQIRLIARRNPQEKEAALIDAYKHYGHGKLILTISGASVLHEAAIRNLTQKFNSEPELEACLLNEQAAADYTIAGLFAMYRTLLGLRVEKFRNVIGLNIHLKDTVCFRTPVFPNQSNLQHTGYAHNAVISIKAGLAPHNKLSGKTKTKQMGFTSSRLEILLSIKKYIDSIIQPILATYLVYLALVLHEPALLLAYLGVLSASLLIAIWEAERLRMIRKTALALGIPLTFGLFYAVAIYRLLATVFGVPDRLINYTRNLRQAG